jgi:uncharacterized membrane protein YsdA (DUF1294 family)
MEDILIIYFVLVNLAAFFTMLVDKRRAIEHRWRVKESTLLLLAILGGSIGEYIGMQTFRHKTKHLKFTLGVPFIIIIQISLVIFLIQG